MGSADSDKITERVCIFCRDIPSVEQFGRYDMMNFETATETSSVFFITNSAYRTAEIVPIDRLAASLVPDTAIDLFQLILGEVVLTPTTHRAILSIERLPPSERLITPNTHNLHLPLLWFLGALIRTVLAVPNRWIILERLAAGSAFTLFHRFPLGNPESTQPVADSRYRDTTFICNVLLVTSLLNVLFAKPLLLLVLRLSLDIVSFEPPTDCTGRYTAVVGDLGNRVPLDNVLFGEGLGLSIAPTHTDHP